MINVLEPSSCVLSQVVQCFVFRVDKLCSQSFGVFGSGVGVRRGAKEMRRVCDGEFRGGRESYKSISGPFGQ